MEWSPTADEAVLEKERGPAEREDPKHGKQPMQPIALAHTFLGGSAVRNGEVSPAQREREKERERERESTLGEPLRRGGARRGEAHLTPWCRSWPLGLAL